MSHRAPELPRTLTFRDLLLFKLVAIVNVSLLTPSASLGRPALWLWAVSWVSASASGCRTEARCARRSPRE